MANRYGETPDHISSPFNSVFDSSGPQHKLALKHAVYNTAALVFVILSGVIAVVVYHVLEAFIRPLVWAALCGAFLHPFQRTATLTVRKWLKSLDETDTPFAIGLVLSPIKVLNETSDLFVKLLTSNAKIIFALGILFPIGYYLIAFKPFLQIFITLEKMMIAISNVLEVFQQPFWVWTIVTGYIIIVIFWWKPTSANVLSKLSLPIWTLLFIYFASYAGKWKVLIFLVLLILLIVGLFEEWKDKSGTDTNGSSSREQFEGVDGVSTEEESVIQKCLFKSLGIFGLTSVHQHDSVEHTHQARSQVIRSNKAGDTKQSKSEADEVDDGEGHSIGKVEEDLTIKSEKEYPDKLKAAQKDRRKNRSSRGSTKRRTGKSDPYFIALFWLFLISRIWSHSWILQFVPIFICIYVGKALILGLKAPEVLSNRFSSFNGKCKQWIDERKDAIVPGPVQAIGKLLLKGDKKVIKWTDDQMEKLITVLIILCLIVITTLSIIFLAVQVQQESVYMGKLVSNAVNETLTNNPELLRWLPENTDVKAAFDDMIHRGYVHGRKWMVEQLNTVLRGQQTNNTLLEKQMTSFVDNIYHQWLSRNATQQRSKVSSNSSKSTRRLAFSFENLRKLIPGNETFEFSAIISLVKENIDTLKSIVLVCSTIFYMVEHSHQMSESSSQLLESIWSILKGNVTVAFSLLTTVLSIIFFSGTYILNMGLSSVVFLTALFYLLSSSGSQYKVVEWISGVSMGTRFSESVNIAVTDVFGATLKMATFYGFYTWVTHSFFSLNIVFIPSALAAIFAAIPFIGTYYAAIPGALELWLVHDQEIYALLLIALHFLPTYVVDITIYSEITGGGHPYLTGLAVAGGMYWFGLEGAIIGPIVLCCLITAFNIYNGIFTEDKQESSVRFRDIKQYDFTPQKTPLFRYIRRALSEERC